MHFVGIDFGGSRLRVATNLNGDPTPFLGRSTERRLPFTVEVGRAAAAPMVGCRITSLKRLLDFDTLFPFPPPGIKSVDLLVERFAAIMGDLTSEGGDSQSRCIVAIPPCFSQRQRSAVRTAASRAGFAPVKLVDDTLAALLASAPALAQYTRILVYAWGASTFSAALYEKTGSSVRVVAQEGDRELGGDDLDAAVATGIIGSGQGERPDISVTPWEVLQAAAEEAERAKKYLARKGTAPTLGTAPEEDQALESSGSDPALDGGFRACCSALTQRTYQIAGKAVERAGFHPEVILAVGGTTHIGTVQEGLRERFRVPIVCATEDAVSVGAAVYAGLLPEAEWPESDSEAPFREDASTTVQNVPPGAPGSEGHGTGSSRRPSDRWLDHFASFFERAQHEYEGGQLARSVETFDGLYTELLKYGADLHRKLAARLNADGDVTGAIEVLERFNRRDPTNLLVAQDLGDCVLRAAPQFRRAPFDDQLRRFQVGIRALRFPGDAGAKSAALLAALLNAQGCLLYEANRIGEAEHDLAESVRLRPENPTYRKNLDITRGSQATAKTRSVTPVHSGVGRNDPCPCGSGRKFKKCCGARR
jgi:hypothetical protein